MTFTYPGDAYTTTSHYVGGKVNMFDCANPKALLQGRTSWQLHGFSRNQSKATISINAWSEYWFVRREDVFGIMCFSGMLWLPEVQSRIPDGEDLVGLGALLVRSIFR
jgi:hypothetical protein